MSQKQEPMGIAVLTDGAICEERGSRPYPTDAITHVTDIAPVALAKSVPLRAIWIAPGTALDAVAKKKTFWEPRDGWRIFATGAYKSTPSSARLRRDEAGVYHREIYIYAALKDRWGIPPKTADAQALLTNIMAYEAVVGQALFSPASTALALLERNITAGGERRKDWLVPLEPTFLRTFRWPQLVYPIWSAKTPPRGDYWHTYDKNSAFLAAAGSRSFGSGQPRKAVGDTYTDKSYGLWQISAQPGTSVYDGLQLPSPWFDSPRSPAKEWFYTPQIKLAKMLGWTVTIHEGYVWDETHELLKDWVTLLYQARQQAKAEDHSTTVRMIKTSYTTAFGIMSKVPGPEDRDHWAHRPDWDGTVVAEHYLRLVSQMDKFRTLCVEHRKRGGLVKLATDAFTWASDDPDPATAIPGILDRAQQLGGYKHTGTTRAGGEPL